MSSPVQYNQNGEITFYAKDGQAILTLDSDGVNVTFSNLLSGKLNLIPNPAPATVPAKLPGVLVPAYYYVPTSSPYTTPFTGIVSAKQLYPNVPFIVVINGQSSGPPTSNSTGYKAVVQYLHTVNITVLGYVATANGTDSQSSIESQMVTWQSYGVDGIFFDEMNTASGGSTLYFNLTAYALTLGMNTTVGNPGTTTLQEYVGSVSILCTREDNDTVTALPTSNYTQSTTGAASGYAFLGYDQASDPGSTVLGYIINGAQWIYLTNSTTPWSVLSTYFNTTVSELSNL